MAWEGINKRRFPRANYSCVVTVRQKGNAETFNTRTENIGCGGVCVMLPKEVAIFSPVEVEIDLVKGENKISCKGTIVWSIRRGEIGKDADFLFDTGIEFSNLKEEDWLLISRVIKECLQQNKS
jgi:hypothetical protein